MSITSLYRRNVGGLDRGIRVVVGPQLVAAGLLAGGIRGEPFGIIVTADPEPKGAGPGDR